nr:vacuolar-sorting protein dot2 [Quercus suber]
MSSSRRGVGLSAFSNASISSDQYARHGQQIRTTHADALANQLSVFQAALHNFSLTHAKDIRSNPSFRAEFARMCNAIGVDPLAGSNVRSATSAGAGKAGSVWAKMLGSSVNDFYFELAVRVVEECRSTRAENGGMISMAEMQTRIEKGRGLVGGGMDVTEDDIQRALTSLEPLGGMFKITALGSMKFIRSVPKELNPDQSKVLEVIQVLGYVTISMLQDNLGWERPRAIAVIDDLIADSLVRFVGHASHSKECSPACCQPFSAAIDAYGLSIVLEKRAGKRKRSELERLNLQAAFQALGLMIKLVFITRGLQNGSRMVYMDATSVH